MIINICTFRSSLCISGLLFVGFTSFLNAQADNFPNICDIAIAERVRVFQTPKKITWFLPIAFSSSFECSESSNALRRSCVLRVFNSMTDAERQSLRAKDVPGHVVTFFSDTDTHIVRTITESFDDLPQTTKSQQLLLKTLRMGDLKVPYASVAFRVSPVEAEKLIQLYETTGLGRFRSVVTLRGECVGRYLAIDDTRFIRQALASIANSSSNPKQVYALLSDAVSKSISFDSGMSREQATYIGAELLRGRFLQFSVAGTYRVKQPEVYSLPNKLILIDETLDVPRFRCEGILELRQSGSQTITCYPTSDE